MDSVSSLYARLAEADWAGDRQAALSHTERVMTEAWSGIGAIICDIKKRTTEGCIPSVRTNELLSWKLASSEGGPCLALNEFMPAARGTASVNVHEHLGELVVLGVRGGYSHDYFATPKPTCEYEDGEEFSNLIKWRGPDSKAGVVGSMDLDVIHGLVDFEPGTTSLTVYAPLARQRTTVFNTLTGKAEHRWTHGAATRQLGSRLGDWLAEM